MGIHRFQSVVGNSFGSAHMEERIQEGEEADQEKYFNDRYQENAITCPQTLS